MPPGSIKIVDKILFFQSLAIVERTPVVFQDGLKPPPTADFGKLDFP
jgi:hypothetical protein